ncbi:MAG: amidohydrolase family protein [Clostridia bacterium]|nr:amidohydrolase family protein [Clostridia bacterium]
MQRIADSHVHIMFMEHEKVSKMLDDLLELGVTDVCLLALPYHNTAENLAVLFNKYKYDKMNVRCFGGLHLTDKYSVIPPKEMVKALLRLGCDGFKMMYAPEMRAFTGLAISDEYYDEMFSLLEETKTPVNIHVADPEEFWNDGGRYASGFPSKEQLYDEIFKMLDKHPNLKVTFAHFFFLSNMKEEAVRVMEKYKNVWFDITPGVEMYYNFDNDIKFWHDFFVKYSDRIMFGTDANTIKSVNCALNRAVYQKLTQSFEKYEANLYGKSYMLNGLQLPEDVVDKICYKNYLARMGERKEVDLQLLKEYAQRMLSDIKAQPDDPYYKKGMELVPSLKDDPFRETAVRELNEILENI